MKAIVLISVFMFFALTACGTTPPPTIPPGPFTPGPLFTAQPTTIAAAPSATFPPPDSTPAPANTVPPTLAPTVAPTVAPTIAPSNTPAPTIAPTAKPATPLPPTPTASAGGLDMHSVDWFKVVTTDPHLTYDTSVPPSPGNDNAPYVHLKSDTNVQGYALVSADRILFLDISGDGQQEAVISIFSGGTAGNLGLLVYTVANGAPILADSLTGYKFGGVADGNRLKVIEPIYQGWEPNCCPSGFFETRYRLQNNHLAQVSRDEMPSPEARQMTVDKFYELLSAKNYSDAYNNFTSAAFRAAHPYKSWVAGYADTESFTTTTSVNRDGTIHVDLVSHDKQGNHTVTHHYVGSWHLVWVSTARFKQWVLDSATFTEVR